MARELKPQKVSVVSHPRLPISIDIMFDRNKLLFFFMVANERIEKGTADEAQREARSRIADLVNVEWEAVIEVDHHEYDGHSYYGDDPRERRRPDRAGLQLRFERYERGKFQGEWCLRRPLEEDCDAYELKRRAERPHEGTRDRPSEGVIPYTAEAWRGLQRIVEGLHAMNDALIALFADNTGSLLARIATSPKFSSQLLFGPSKPLKRRQSA